MPVQKKKSPAARKPSATKRGLAIRKNGRFIELTGVRRKESFKVSIDPAQVIFFHPHLKDPENKSDIFISGQSDHIVVAHAYAVLSTILGG